MNKGMLTVGIIILAISALLLINVISNYGTGGELDYYLVKETSEQAMQDAMDNTFFARHGLLRMDKELFVESFVRRFANNVDNTRDYTIGFYGMNEVPPKVSIKVDSLTTLSFKGEAAQISTSINQLAETDYIKDPYVAIRLNDKNASEGKPIKLDEKTQNIVIDSELFTK